MKESQIQWTDFTWNPWQGCAKVSEGCKFCYMFRDKTRYGQNPTFVHRSSPTTFEKPLFLKEPARVFTCSWSDFFIEDADAWRKDAWEIIKKTPHLTYQILTKRPQRILECLPPDWGEGYPNVWIGVTVENQKRADERIPILQKVPAKLRFLSCEPLLEHVKLRDLDGIGWVIVGGESGNDNGEWKYRPCQMQWIRTICCTAWACDVPVFLKQLGTHIAKAHDLKDRHGGDVNEWGKVDSHIPVIINSLQQFPN